MGMRFVGINGNRDCYHPDQMESCTVGEFISYLQNFDEDMPLYLVNDNGYTYGSLSESDIEEHYVTNDGDLDGEEDEDDLDEAVATPAKKHYQNSETYYIDIDGMFGEHGEIYSEEDFLTYWEENKNSDPVLMEYDSYEEWLQDTLQWMESVEGYELNESKKIRKDKLYIKDSKPLVEDNVDVMDLFKGVDSKDMDHWGSDLYVRKTPETTKIINSLPDMYKKNVTTFRDEIDFDIWYEIPFVWHK